MNAPLDSIRLEPQTIEFKLDGHTVQAFEGETILSAAQRAGVQIPRLCFTEGLRPDGNCRACVVEVAGERTLAPSCCRAVKPGMEVQATSERARKSQQMVLEMLLSDMPEQGHHWLERDESLQHGELSDWADRLCGVMSPYRPPRARSGPLKKRRRSR